MMNADSSPDKMAATVPPHQPTANGPSPKSLATTSMHHSPGQHKAKPKFEYPNSPQKAAELLRTKRLPTDMVSTILSDPDIRNDKLPQPYRLVDNIIQRMLADLNNRILAIDKRVSTPSYEGHLKDSWATGALEINGVTAISTEANTHYLSAGKFNRVILGDKFGGLHLVDCARKLELTKVEAFPGRRVTSVSTATVTWLDTNLVTVAAVARGSADINIYYYKNNESKLYHYYRYRMMEPTEAAADTPVAGFPRLVRLSADGFYLSVVTYDGQVVVLKTPEIPEPKLKAEFQQTLGQLHIPGKKEGKSSLASLTSMYQSDPASIIDASIEGTEPQDLPLDEYVVLRLPAYKPPVKEPPPEEPHEEEEKKDSKKTGDPKKGGKKPDGKKEAKKVAKKEAKKDSKKPTGKKETKKAEVEEEESEPTIPPVVFGAAQADEEKGDAGNEVAYSQFHPLTFFVQSSHYYKPESVKGPRAIRKILLTSSVIVIYTGAFEGAEYLLAGKDGLEREQKDYSLDKELTKVLRMKPKSLPKEKKLFIDFVNAEFPKDPASPEKPVGAAAADKDKSKGKEKEKPKEKKQPDSAPEETAPQPKKLKRFEAGKLITCADYTESGESDQLLALGLADGTMIVYDIAFNYPKGVIKKLDAPISALAFNQRKHLVVGYNNGYVAIIKIEKDWPLVARARVHQDKKSPVVLIGTSTIGTAVACDSEGSVRLFDLYRGKKIGKLTPELKHSTHAWGWRLLPQTLIVVQKDTIIAIPQHTDPTGPSLHSVIEKAEGQTYISALKSLPPAVPTKIPPSVAFLFRIEDLLLSNCPGLASQTRPDLSLATVFEGYDENRKPGDLPPALPPFKTEDISSIKKSARASQRSSQLSHQDPIPAIKIKIPTSKYFEPHEDWVGRSWRPRARNQARSRRSTAPQRSSCSTPNSTSRARRSARR